MRFIGWVKKTSNKNVIDMSVLEANSRIAKVEKDIHTSVKEEESCTAINQWIIMTI